MLPRQKTNRSQLRGRRFVDGLARLIMVPHVEEMARLM
jgi:hypothetical protein